MKKSEIIARMNENIEWLEDEIKTLEGWIVETSGKMQGQSISQIISFSEFIAKYARDIEAKKDEIVELENRIKIVKTIED